MKISWLRPKNFRSFWEKISAELSKLRFTFPGDTLGKKVFGSLLVSYIFLILGQKKLDFRWKFFHSPSKLYLTCPRRQFNEKIVFRLNRKSLFFGFLVKKLFREACQICILLVHSPTLSIWWSFDKNFVCKPLQTLGEKLSNRWNKARRDWQKHSSCARDAFSLT